MDNTQIQHVYTQVNGALDSIYKKRRTTQFFQKLMWILTGVYFVGMLLVMGMNYVPSIKTKFPAVFNLFTPTVANPYATVYPFLVFLVLLYVSTSIFTRQFQKFKILEMETMANMVKNLFPKVDFAQNTKAPTQEIIQSKLFTWLKTNTPIYSYGQIRSIVNGVQINITDVGVLAENVEHKLIGTLMRIPLLNMVAVLYQFVLKNIFTNKSADNVNYTYRGMFCWLSFQKKLNGHTVMLPKSRSTALDRMVSLNFKEEEKILLEDPRFTNQFIVYSTDQVEARYVLSSALMERVVALKEKFNQPILLSFQNNQLYLAVANEHGLFSFPSGKLNSVRIIETLAHDIETALRVGEQLQLT